MKTTYFAHVDAKTGLILDIFDEAYLLHNSIPHSHMVRGEVDPPPQQQADEWLERQASIINNELRISWVIHQQPLTTLFMLAKRPFANPELYPRLRKRCSQLIMEQFQKLAKQYDYDSFELLVSYANSKDVNWRKQAQYAIDRRDAVYNAFYPLMDAMEADHQRYPDNEAGLLAQLPEISWADIH